MSGLPALASVLLGLYHAPEILVLANVRDVASALSAPTPSCMRAPVPTEWSWRRRRCVVEGLPRGWATFRLVNRQ